MIRLPAQLQGLLQRAGAPDPMPSQSHLSHRAARRKTMVFESLEPRLLLSADLAPDVAGKLQTGLNQFKDWTSTQATYQQLGQQLPVVSTSLGSAADLSGWLQTKLVDPVQAYLSGGGTKTTDGLVGALAGISGLSAVSGDQYGNQIRFDLVLDASRTLNGINLDGAPVAQRHGDHGQKAARWT